MSHRKQGCILPCSYSQQTINPCDVDDGVDVTNLSRTMMHFYSCHVTRFMLLCECHTSPGALFRVIWKVFSSYFPSPNKTTFPSNLSQNRTVKWVRNESIFEKSHHLKSEVMSSRDAPGPWKRLRASLDPSPPPLKTCNRDMTGWCASPHQSIAPKLRQRDSRRRRPRRHWAPKSAEKVFSARGTL